MSMCCGDQLVRATALTVGVAVCSSFAASPLRAQAVVRGLLYNDSTGLAVRGTVMLVDPNDDSPVVHVICDSLGEFTLRVPAGRYQIAAVRDGYVSTLSAPIALRSGEQMTVRVPIAMAGELQHRIGVVEHIQPGASAIIDSDALASAVRMGAQTRRVGGPGLHYGRGDFDKSPFNTLGEFLQGLPGVSILNPSSAGTLQMSRGGLVSPSGIQSATSCRVGWFVDGHRMDIANQMDPVTDRLGGMQLDMLEGVEVFRGLSEMPVDLATPDLRCGAVAIWTRRG